MLVKVNLFRTEYAHVYLDVDSIDEAKELVMEGCIDDVQLEDFGYEDSIWEASDDGYEIVDDDEWKLDI
jgi:hypothetical protein